MLTSVHATDILSLRCSQLLVLPFKLATQSHPRALPPILPLSGVTYSPRFLTSLRKSLVTTIEISAYNYTTSPLPCWRHATPMHSRRTVMDSEDIFCMQSQQSSAHNQCCYNEPAHGDRGETLSLSIINSTVQIDTSLARRGHFPFTQSKLSTYHPFFVIPIKSRVKVNFPLPRSFFWFEFSRKNHVSPSLFLCCVHRLILTL